MSEDRDTHQIVTPRGHTLELRSWINGREKQRIDGAMFGSFATEVDKDGNPQPKMSDTMQAAQENAAILAIVVTVDNSENDVLNKVLDMRVDDFEFVTKHLDKIVKGDFDEKKEQTSSGNIGESSEPAEAESQTLVSP